MDAGTYFFPSNLPSYVTLCGVPAGCLSRLTVSVIEGQPVTLRPVYAESLAELVAGSWSYFAGGVDVSIRGLYASEWGVAPRGELYVAILIEAAETFDEEALLIGLAEVQLRGA